jgi:hypothetical protein
MGVIGLRVIGWYDTNGFQTRPYKPRDRDVLPVRGLRDAGFRKRILLWILSYFDEKLILGNSPSTPSLNSSGDRIPTRAEDCCARAATGHAAVAPITDEIASPHVFPSLGTRPYSAFNSGH